MTTPTTTPARSHGPSKHGPGCACTRCRGFQEGHQLSVRHGAYSRLQLTEAAGETADVVRELVPAVTDFDEPLVQIAAYTLEQLRAADKALSNDKARKLELSKDARAWVRVLLETLDRLGMGPANRAKLGLDLAELKRRTDGSGDNYDLSKLSDAEYAQLETLLQKAVG